MQLPWYLIHQLIYGLHTALHNPQLPPEPGPGERQSSTTPEAERVGEASSVQFIDPLIVLCLLEGK